MMSIGWLLLFPLLWLWYLNHKKLQEITTLKIHESELQTKLTEIEKSYIEKLSLATETKEKMSEIFKGFSLEAMEKFHKKSQEDLSLKETALAKTIQPVKDGLEKLDHGMRQMEKERKG